jgi:hypothetical protein
MLFGAVGYWYNWHLATTRGEFVIKLCVFVPVAVSGGLLILLRPDWTGPLRKDSTRGHKIALFAVVGFMAVGSGVEFFRLKHYLAERAPQQRVIAFSPSMGTPVIPASLAARVASPSITFLGRQYRLGSFNQRSNAMWEFVTGADTADNWKTLLTIIDRPDARTREDLDRLAEGILSAYRSRGGRILMAKTMGQTPETVFNYMVAAFDEPGEQRYELNFAKMSLGSGNAVVAIYGVRIADDRDYRAKSSEFLGANSAEIGRALEKLVLPDLGSLPRRPF